MTRTIHILTAAGLLAVATTARAGEFDAVTPKMDATASQKADDPATFELGKYASGRLAKNRAHFWAVDLPPGEYTVVIDGWGASNTRGHVGFGVGVYDSTKNKSEDIRGANVNASNSRGRGVGTIVVSEVGKTVFQVGNGSNMIDYRLGVFKDGKRFEPACLGRKTEVRPLKMGETVTTPVLKAGDFVAGDVYYVFDLPAGDFKFAAEFAAQNPRALNSGVEVDLLNLNGKHTLSVLTKFVAGTSGRAAAKVITAEESRVLVRVRGTGADVTATLKVEKMDE